MRSGRYSASVPFLVQAPERARLLVVVPAITWLGVDKVDDDGDGLPNTLETGGPVKWPRVIAGDKGMPATFADQTAPLLVFLDRARIRYDLTSDIALDPLPRPAGDRPRGRDPGRPAALGAGARWRGGCGDYVEDGGRLASFGTDSLRRGVRVGSNRLTQPTQPTPTDPFGARLDPIRRPRTDETGPLPLTALADDPALGLLTGSDGVVDAFGRLEESQPRQARGGKVVTALGQDVTDAERADAEEKGEQPREALPVADRGAPRQGRRHPRRADRVGAAGRHGPRGGADHAQHRRRPAAGQAARALRLAGEDPQLRHPQLQRGDVEVGGDRERQRRALRRGGVELLVARRPRSGSGSPYQSSAVGWRASIAPAR